MKTIKQFAVMALSAAAMVACSKDNEQVTGNGGNVVAGEPCAVNLVIATDAGSRGMTDNFVDGTNDENAIKTLEFYVFDSAGAPDEEVGKANGDKGYIKFTTTTNERLHQVIMSGGNDKKIVAVINMNLGKLADADNTYANLKAKLASGAYAATAGGSDHNARIEARTEGFEMTGEKEFNLVAGSINSTISINVSRLASRINAPTFKTTAADFINLNEDGFEEIWGADWETDLENKTLTYVSGGYAVINGRAKSDAFFIGNADGNDRKLKTKIVGGTSFPVPDWDLWSGTGKAVLSSSFDANGFYTNNYSGKGQAADWFLSGVEADNEHRVYVYENKPGTITANQVTGYNPAETYAFIIKGTFVVDGDVNDPLTKTRYWRINLTRDDDYHVFRNASYATTVNRISTPGYNTPEEAETESPVIPGTGETAADVKISVDQWRLNEYATDM